MSTRRKQTFGEDWKFGIRIKISYNQYDIQYLDSKETRDLEKIKDLGTLGSLR